MKNSFYRYNPYANCPNVRCANRLSDSLRQVPEAWRKPAGGRYAGQLPMAGAEPGETAALAQMQTANENTHPVSSTAAGLNAYGCVYHNGSQKLAVQIPATSVAVRFSSNACLRQITHLEGDAELTVSNGGDYEIAYELCLTTKTEALAAFELQANGTALPGGRVCEKLISGSQVCSGFVMATLRTGDTVRLVMTSATVCETELSSGGVSGRLKILKLGDA